MKERTLRVLYLAITGIMAGFLGGTVEASVLFTGSVVVASIYDSKGG